MYDEAMKIDRDGIELALGSNLPYSVTPFYDNMANCFMYSGKYDSANYYFNKCIPIDSAIGDKRLNADSYLNIGTLYNKQKLYPQAIESLKRAIALASDVNAKKVKLEAGKLLAQAYESKGDHSLAYTTMYHASLLKDSILNEFTEAKSSELEAIYENEKNQVAIADARAENKIRQLLNYGLSALILLVAVIAVLIYRRKQVEHKLRLQKEINLQQQHTAKAMMQAENRERERIAAELHDGVGQMLSAAKMNLSAIDDHLLESDTGLSASIHKVTDILGDSINEVKNLSYSMMPATLHQTGLKNALTNLVRKAKTENVNITLFTENIDEPLPQDMELNLYRIAQETLNNALKHSGASRIQISLFRENDMISYVIEDNGKGFDKDNMQEKASMGFKNIFSRISYLRGNFEINTTENKGTVIALHIPVK